MPQPALILPFRPFTIDQVYRIAGCPGKVLEQWVPSILPWRMGEDGFTMGLEYMQLFALFVGNRYLEQGAPRGRAESVVRYVADTNLDFINQEIARGNSFPVPVSMMTNASQQSNGCMVPAPDTPLGRRLNLRVLLEEFEQRLKTEFPNG